MKKVIGFVWFLIIGFVVYAQNNLATYYVNKCISLLNKPVPNDFQRIGRTEYKNAEDIVVDTENGIIVFSSFGFLFEKKHEAMEFNGFFYSFFEENNWKHYRRLNDGTDMYLKNGIYAGISPPSYREDGYFVANIGFTINFR
jgi:hypothetical protein